MRRARPVLAGAVLAVATLAPVGTAAHPTDEFDACLTREDVDVCDDAFSYLFGDVVVLKATVSPVHNEAVVLIQAPGSDRWERLRWVTISKTGQMKFRWHTHRRDAVQDAPYLLRFRIPGHGKSDIVEAFVLFGE